MKEQKIGDCRLNKDAKVINSCTASACRSCGWEAKEALRRRTLLRENGLTLCDDGLRRLKLGKRTADKNNAES